MAVSLRCAEIKRPEARASRALAIAKNVTYVFWGLSLLLLVLCAFAVLVVFLQTGAFTSPGTGIKAAIATLGNLVSGAIMTAAFWQIKMLFEDTLDNNTPFGSKQARRMRVLAATLALAGTLGASAVIAACALGYAAFGGIVFSSLPGIEVFGTPFGNPDGVGLAYVDTTFFVLAAIAWGLSFVFDYGGYLQTENDLTL